MLFSKLTKILGGKIYSITGYEPIDENSFTSRVHFFDDNPVSWDQLHQLEIESAKKDLRNERTRILAESDWMANSDVTMSDAWRDYRQALRDLPANSPNVALDEQGNLINVTWPTKPE